uniref:Uncharacterized protein n=1 Tax=Florenciella parvula TaxID=236787 RepID=A0A7S2BH57_9STRA
MGKERKIPRAPPKKPPARKKKVQGGLSLAQTGVALAVVIVAAGWWYLGQGNLTYLKPSNTDKLKEVFFGRDPWVVICTNSSVHEVFEGASTKVKDVNFGVLDCNAQLPSKKTTMQRLKLEKKKPVMFYSAYGRKPRQLQPKLLSSEYSLVRELRALGMMHAVKVKDTMHLQEACLSRAACGLVLTTSGNVDDTSLETLNALSDEFSSMNWVVVDASKLRLKSPSEKELGLPKFDSSGHRLILFTEKGESHAATSEEDDEMSNRLATPYLGPFTAEKAASFVRDVLGEQTERKPASVGIFGGDLALTKRKKPTPPPPPPQQTTTKTEPADEPPPTPLPTAERDAQAAAEKEARIKRELERRAQMDAEASDFIVSAEEDEYDEEEDEEEDEYVTLD